MSAKEYSILYVEMQERAGLGRFGNRMTPGVKNRLRIIPKFFLTSSFFVVDISAKLWQGIRCHVGGVFKESTFL